ncbi:DNA polymerase III subunit epsilon [Sneathiella glossodoripedis]|uniref:DNA polymerase III subunit epsilon n=1 Tax=Sneathiella glossodoripedis TaxID=418853 RepID=UPI00047217F4|nr:DNA polymerase III subunit epsilon [Sneathiella glossodoripedis]
MREIALDTETTGFDPSTGDRIVEIGCVELENYMATGRVFHVYINPERDMPEAAFKVHGLSEEFLKQHPVIAEVMDDFLDFIGDSNLVIHNAEFDMKFINAELIRMKRRPLGMDRTVDTVAMARKMFPGAQANLDALCRRFNIDNSAREKHGALLDAELLAEVYLELRGGRQTGFSLGASGETENTQFRKSVVRPPRPHAPSDEELAAHSAFLEKLSDPIWNS